MHPASRGDVDKDRVFLWDNQSAHNAPQMVYQIVGKGVQVQTNSEFCVGLRVNPKLLPLSIKFATFATSYTNKGESIDKNTTAPTATTWLLEQIMINDIVGTVGADYGNFNNTFDHCDYTINGIYPPGGYDCIQSL